MLDTSMMVLNVAVQKRYVHEISIYFFKKKFTTFYTFYILIIVIFYCLNLTIVLNIQYVVMDSTRQCMTNWNWKPSLICQKCTQEESSSVQKYKQKEPYNKDRNPTANPCNSRVCMFFHSCKIFITEMMVCGAGSAKIIKDQLRRPTIPLVI